MKKIPLSQIGCCVYLLILANYLGTTCNNIIILAKQDAWISIIISFIIGLIPLFMFIKIMDYEPDLNIALKNQKLFGKLFGNILNILLILFIFLFTIELFWNISNFIASQYLDKTPTIFIGLATSICIIYLLNNDIYTIFRTLFILCIIGIALYITGTLGLINKFELYNLKPYLEFGILNPFLAALKSTAYNILPLFMITIIPKNKIENCHKLGKVIITWYTIAALVMFVIMLLTIGIFGPKLSIIYQYTAFHLLKNISIFSFIDRIESTISIRWILYSISFITISLYFIMTTIKAVIKKENQVVHKFMCFIFPLLLVFLSELFFKNNITKYNFSSDILPYLSGFFFFMIPLFIFISSKLKT